jgi:hypothetical protein
MSEPRDVRRFGRQNRKQALPPVPPLFPPEEMAAADEPDFMALMPDTDQEALATLAQLPPDAVRPLKITPPEQRFPPLQPDSDSVPLPMAAPAPKSTPSPPPVPQHRWLYNIITLFACSGTLAMLVIYGIIWREPQSWLNPLPPDIVYIEVTATPGTAPQNVIPTPMLVVNPSDFPFVMTDAGIVYIANANGRGCEWASIAGSVTTEEGTALNGYRVRVTGANFDETVFTGAALTFGAGGFEMPLGNAPQTATYNVQLFSPQGAPLSDVVVLTTRAECEANVTLVNFAQNRDL